MAEVYRARRRGPRRLRQAGRAQAGAPRPGRDPRFVQMFIEEARLAARLSLPQPGAGLRLRRGGGLLLPGDGVRRRHRPRCLLQRAGRLSLDGATHVGLELCEALAAVHNARDATGRAARHRAPRRDAQQRPPLDARRGEARRLRGGQGPGTGAAHRRRHIKGKLAYLSPEQARGDEVDARTDLYGLGLLLFEIADRRALSRSRQRRGARTSRRAAAAATGLASRARCRPHVDAVLARALAVEPERRYPSAAAMAEGIRSWSAELRSAAGQAGAEPTRRSSAPRRERRCRKERGCSAGLGSEVRGCPCTGPDDSRNAPDRSSRHARTPRSRSTRMGCARNCGRRRRIVGEWRAHACREPPLAPATSRPRCPSCRRRSPRLRTRSRQPPGRDRRPVVAPRPQRAPMRHQIAALQPRRP